MNQVPILPDVALYSYAEITLPCKGFNDLNNLLRQCAGENGVRALRASAGSDVNFDSVFIILILFVISFKSLQEPCTAMPEGQSRWAGVWHQRPNVEEPVRLAARTVQQPKSQHRIRVQRQLRRTSATCTAKRQRYIKSWGGGGGVLDCMTFCSVGNCSDDLR